MPKLIMCSFTIDVRPQGTKKAIESVRMVFTKTQPKKGYSIAMNSITHSQRYLPHTIDKVLLRKALSWWLIGQFCLPKVSHLKGITDALEQAI